LAGPGLGVAPSPGLRGVALAPWECAREGPAPLLPIIAADGEAAEGGVMSAGPAFSAIHSM
jgi:hypothetical protein